MPVTELSETDLIKWGLNIEKINANQPKQLNIRKAKLLWTFEKKWSADDWMKESFSNESRI